MSSLSQYTANALIKFGRLIVWFYYSPIRIIGKNNLPSSGPLLLVANHANSLIDAVLVGLAAGRRVRFLAKAPLFEIPLFGRLLRWVGMIPVHRPVDDPTQVRRSLQSLTKAAEALAAGAAIGIFPEGKSHDSRTLTELPGGTARMIQQALEVGAAGLQVVPVGINYDDKRVFGSAVWIEIGKPIDVAALLAQSKSTAEGRRLVTREIAHRLRGVIIHLDDQRLEPFLEDLELLDPALQSSGDEKVFSLQQRKSVADALNHFRKTQPDKVDSIGRALVVHRLQLKAQGLRVGSDLVNLRGRRRMGHLLWRTLRLGFGLIPVLGGVMQNALPLVVERWIVRFLPQTGATTMALSRLAVGVPVFALWYGFTWWLLRGYFLPWVAWFWVLATPFAGLFAYRYFRNLAGVAGDWRDECRLLFKRGVLHKLRATQSKLRGRLSRLSDEYASLRAPIPAKRQKWRESPVFRRVILTGGVAASVLFFVVCSLRVGFRSYTLESRPGPPPDFSKVEPAAMERVVAGDEARLVRVLETMAGIGTSTRALKSGFDSDALSFFDDADNDRISQQMLTYLNCRQELLELIFRYRAGNTITVPQLRWRASLIDLAAGCSLYQRSTQFVALFADAPRAQRKLNEGDPAWGIPAGLYNTIRANLTDERNLAPFRTALAEYRAAAGQYDAAGLSGAGPHADFHRLIRQTTVTPPADTGFMAKLWQEAGNLKASTLYHGQSAISRAVGSTRVRQRREGPRVQSGQLEKIRQLVRPGDILLERQDWFLSRAFMPGYWAHAALYIGTVEEVEELGLQTHQWVAPHWEAFKRLDADGHRHVIIEAVPEGVRFTTLEHCLGTADSAAVLRPSRISREELGDAVARAFHHLGKPYDFEFDFFSADKIVCTELVTRCYAESTRLGFPLVNVMGRPTLPPTEIARKFSVERHSPARQLDLVIFLDGHARRDQAIEADEAAFVATLNRPGMTWFSSPD
jgi:1-acyl-sn-glycerol-3-phosphate acyltransferase